MIDDADSMDGIDFDAILNDFDKQRLKLSRSKARLEAKLRKQAPHKRTASPEASPVDVSHSSKMIETLLSGIIL